MALYLTPLVNGKAYEHADITLILLGAPITGLTAIEYGDESDMQEVFGVGRYPVARTHGVVTSTAKLTLLKGEVQNIVNAAPNGRLFDIPEFDIIVSYTDDSLIPVVHTLKNCRFKNNNVTSTQGSDAITQDLDLLVSNIKRSLG